MTNIGNATKTVINTLIVDTFKAAEKWFKSHADEPFCYWGKDFDFLPASATEQEKADFMQRHKEVEDLNDHTIVQFDPYTRALYLSKFCPRIRDGLKDMFEARYDCNSLDGYHWRIVADKDNYKLVCYEED